MPPLPVAHMLMVLRAVLALVAIGATVMTGITVMDYSSNHYSNSTNLPLPPLPNSLAVTWAPKHGSVSCPTCLFVGPDNLPVEDHERLPTPTLPLKISYAAPLNLHTKPTPTPMTAPKVEPPRESSTPGLASFPLSFVREHLIGRNIWVLAFAVVWSLCASTIVGFLLPRLATRKNIPAEANLTKESPRMSRTTKRIFARLRNTYQDKLSAAYERGIFAAADIGASFGPSLQNAEFDLRHRMDKVEITIDKREDIMIIFNKVLHSFIYALAVEESKPEGANARYLSAIDAQRNLIDSLRLLHVFREHAFKENEELVRLVCRRNIEGDLAPENDNFRFSPIDGPTALSMMVSISSVPFDNRPDTILDSDPHWKKFVASIAGKRSEQEERLTFEEANLIGDNVEDASALGNHDVSQHHDQEEPEKQGIKEDYGIKDASEQNHHDVKTSDHTTSSKKPAVDEMSRKKHIDVAKPKSPSPSMHENVKGEMSSDKHTHPAKLKSPSPSVHENVKGEHLATNPQEDKGDYLGWLKWNVTYLTKGYGTPDDPNPKPYSDVVVATPSTELTGDEAIARRFQEEENALWRKDRIEVFQRKIASLKAARGNKTLDECATGKEVQPMPVTTTEVTLGEELSNEPQEEDLDLRKDEVGGKMAITHTSEQDDESLIDRPLSPQQGRHEQKGQPFLNQSPRTTSTFSSDHPTNTDVHPTEDTGGNAYVRFLQQKSDAPASFQSDFNWRPNQSDRQEASTMNSENSALGSDTPVTHAEASGSSSPNTDEASNAQPQPELPTALQKRKLERKLAKEKKVNEARAFFKES